MLKQSLVQEKLSDLNSTQLQSQMPQWSRVQLGKHLTANLKRNNKIALPVAQIDATGDFYSKAIDQNGNEVEMTHATLMDPTQKLKYLEKSIKFIQEQHNDTLNSLHDEIEKLKMENRDLHFKLVTNQRRSSSAKSSIAGDKSLKTSHQKHEIHQLNSNSNSNMNVLTNKDPILERKFNKLINESANEQNLDKRLNNIKFQFENLKYEELVIRLRDAESKNEYLTNVITQLQDKRNLNSAYKPSTSNDQEKTRSHSAHISKVGVNNIFSVDPLKICINENDAPRAPSLDECEVLIRKLYDVYKHQKQQISNMKAVLKDMLHTENLSNQGMMMTRDVLENSTRFNKNLIENSCKSFSTKEINQLGSQHSNKKPTATNHFNNNSVGMSNVTGIFMPNYDLSGTNSSTTLHLPPLHLPPNPNKYIEKQRRTQLLQKQRLKKEYFN